MSENLTVGTRPPYRRYVAIPPEDLDYVIHIPGQPSKAFYNFQQKRLKSLLSALDKSNAAYTIERRRVQ